MWTDQQVFGPKQRAHNPSVVGSSPTRPTSLTCTSLRKGSARRSQLTADRTANRFRVLLAVFGALVTVALLAQPASAGTRPAAMQIAAPTGPALLAPTATTAAPEASAAGVVAAPAAVQVITRPSGTNPGGNPLAPPHSPPPPVGVLWGANVDAQIRQAISVDNGNETPFADSWLASGIAQRAALGWDDPTALHYLHAALGQANPYGLGYAYDAFQNGTTNPPTTVYAITLVQVGWVTLEAYQHGKVPLSEVTAIEAKLLAHPHIAVPVGVGLAYSNDPNDVQVGYSVHNVNQAVAIFLQDCLDAGVTYSDSNVRTLVAGLNAYELSAYQPAINGWPYRSGGPQSVQDPAHAGLGAEWGQRFYPATIGAVNTRYVETTDYGYALGSGVHASLAQWDCPDSRRWLGQYTQYMADPTYQDFGSAAKSTRMMAQSATACGAPTARTGFALKTSGLRATQTVTKHVAPDSMVG